MNTGKEQRKGNVRRIEGWPSSGVIVRVPPRRLESAGADSDSLPYQYFVFERERIAGPDTSSLPGWPRALQQKPIVLLLAAEDVLLTSANVPPLSAGRLRDALPNLIEDRTLVEVSTLHVVQVSDGVADTGADADARPERALRALAAVDRPWLASVLARFSAAGLRVRSVLPEALCVPFSPGNWSLVCVGALANPEADREAIREANADTHRMWLRTGRDQAYALPSDFGGASSMIEAIAEIPVGHASRPANAAPKAAVQPVALAVYAPVEAMPHMLRLAQAAKELLEQARGRGAAAESIEIHSFAGDALRLWLENSDAAGGSPRSLLQNELAKSFFGAGAAAHWRRAALLAAALIAVQCIAMQVQWTQLRAERANLRAQAESALKTAFPATTTVLDAPLQMARGLAGLRAQVGRSDPGDFTALVSACGQIFSDAPVNAFRGFEYGAERGSPALRIRLAPGIAVNADERAALAQRAAGAGYDLHFESGSGAASASAAGSQILSTKAGSGESVALLKLKAAG
jgi:general secretion pathway protein L